MVHGNRWYAGLLPRFQVAGLKIQQVQCRQGIKHYGPFGSIFLLFSNKISQGSRP